jgi:hypothetical protein
VKFAKELEMEQMDADGELDEGDGHGFYEMTIGGTTYAFHQVQLAPPAGVFGENYSR